jgi:hypothetical protein
MKSYPKNIKVSKTEAIRAMLDGKKVFMTLWRHEPYRYIFWDGSEFKNSNGSECSIINTMSGDFRVVTDDK